MKYTESSRDLANRIRAHKLYSRTSLEAVLERTLEDVPAQSNVLDLGCGSGNFYAMFASRGRTYVGLDVSKELLEQHSTSVTPRPLLIEASMDSLPAFAPGTFGAIFAIYSIYYSEAPEALLTRLEAMLGTGGKLTLVGPSRAAHAPEIEAFCQSLGDESAGAAKKNQRLDSFHTVIIPSLTELFGRVAVDDVDTSLLFPDAEEWSGYVCSTPQVREASSLSERELLHAARNFSANRKCIRVSKGLSLAVALK